MRTAFVLICFFISIQSSAQIEGDSVPSSGHETEMKAASIAAIIGYKYYQRGALELGLGYYEHQINSHGHISFTAYGGLEMAAYNKGTLLAPKVGVWANSSLTTIGISMLQFMHGGQKNLVFRPEAGIGILFFRVYYAYNWTIKNKAFQPVSRNMLGVSLTVPLSKRLYTEKK
jgi:hypothetical protein